jgi:hypothetical protein
MLSEANQLVQSKDPYRRDTSRRIKVFLRHLRQRQRGVNS